MLWIHYSGNVNLPWVILVIIHNLCIHKQYLLPTRGKQGMKKSVPSISIPVVNINLHCSGEITNKSNLTASQYRKLSARRPEFSRKVREWWKPAESTEPVQNNTSAGPETAGIILPAAETQLLDSTPHGTAGLMSPLNTSKLKPEENLSRCNRKHFPVRKTSIKMSDVIKMLLK